MSTVFDAATFTLEPGYALRQVLDLGAVMEDGKCWWRAKFIRCPDRVCRGVVGLRSGDAAGAALIFQGEDGGVVAQFYSEHTPKQLCEYLRNPNSQLDASRPECEWRELESRNTLLGWYRSNLQEYGLL